MGRSPRLPVRPAAARPAAVAVVLALVAASASFGAGGLFGARGASAQSPTPVTPFPRSIMAFVPADRVGAATTIDPALAVQSVAVAEGDGIGSDDDRVVTVGFRTPVTLPAGAYRVSVLVGDPNGARTRASFVATDGEPTGGTIETSTDGQRWTSVGATESSLDGDSLRITAPVGSAPAGGGLWLEAQIGTDPARRSQSPVFSLDALLGRNTAGALAASGFATMTPGASGDAPPSAESLAVAEPVAIPTAPPTLTADAHLTVTETEPVPDTLAGQPVVNALDEITFMPGYAPDGTTPAVVQINRTTGTIRALAGTSGLPTDRTGDASFVVEGLPAPPASSGASKVVLDLAGVAQALNLPLLDPEALGIGLRRKLTLADGRDVVGSPTMATLTWYETASPTGPPETLAPPTTDAASTTTDGSWSGGVVLAIGVAVVLVLALVAIVLVVRRRRTTAVDRWLDEYTPDEPHSSPDAESMAAARVHAAAVAGPGLERPVAEEVSIDAAPVVVEPEPEPEPDSEPGPEPEPEAELEPEADVEPEPEPEREPEQEPEQEPEPEPEPEPEDHRRSPADALASLEAEVSALTERVDRLEGPTDPPTGRAG